MYMCTQGGVGEGQAYDSTQATHRRGMWFKRQTGQDRYLDTPAQGESQSSNLMRCFSSRWCNTDAIWKYYLSRLPWRFFVHPKMGFFSVNKEVFPIGICLRGPIRGTGSDGKLNLLLNLPLVDICCISAVGFYQNLVQPDTIAFITSLYEINRIIKEKEALDRI